MENQDYEAIAASIHRTGMASRIGKKLNSEQTLRLAAIDLAATLAADNPNMDREYRERCPDAPEVIEFAEDGDAYPHGIGGTNHVPGAVTPWAESPHYVE